MTSISGTRPEADTAARARFRSGFGGNKVLLLCALIPYPLTGCRKHEAVQETAPAVKLPPMPKEIVGRWKIARDDGCGIVSMDDDQSNRYIGKIAVIEPRRMALMNDAGVILKDRLGELGHAGDEHDELLCRFTNVKVSSKDTEEYLTELTGCGPGNPIFDSFIKKVGSKKVKVFQPEPECPGTGFYQLLMPDLHTLMIHQRGIFFFMKRADGVGEAGTVKQSS